MFVEVILFILEEKHEDAFFSLSSISSSVSKKGFICYLLKDSECRTESKFNWKIKLKIINGYA